MATNNDFVNKTQRKNEFISFFAEAVDSIRKTNNVATLEDELSQFSKEFENKRRELTIEDVDECRQAWKNLKLPSLDSNKAIKLAEGKIQSNIAEYYRLLSMSFIDDDDSIKQEEDAETDSTASQNTTFKATPTMNVKPSKKKWTADANNPEIVLFSGDQDFLHEAANIHVHDEDTNMLNIPQTLLGLIRHGESLGYDMNHYKSSFSELYKRYFPDMNTLEAGCFTADSLFDSLLDMHNKQANSKVIDNHQVNKSHPKKYHRTTSALNEAALQYTFIVNDPRVAEKLLERKNAFTKFCEETNLNGWYFMSKKNIYSRVFWAFVIMLSIFLAFFSTYIIISEFMEASIIITIGSVTSTLDKVVFPSIIVCNQNKVGL